jgi:hypothetical protein
LGGLPLAHEQAAAYCEQLGVSLSDYARRFAATPARLLDDHKRAPAEFHDGQTVARAFALAIEQAALLHPAAEALIVHAASLFRCFCSRKDARSWASHSRRCWPMTVWTRRSAPCGSSRSSIARPSPTNASR